MALKKYRFDRVEIGFKKVTHSVWSLLRLGLKYFLVSVSLSVVYYIIFAAFVNSDNEKRMYQENKLYSSVFHQVLDREKIVADVITDLQWRDRLVYREVFNTEAPAMNPVRDLDFMAVSDTVVDRHLVRITAAKADSLLSRTAKVEENFRRFFDTPVKELPPLSMPLEGASYAQVGASVGEKYNPFYKVPMMHNGLDLIASQGDPVVACGDGVVTDVVKSRKSQGNYVEIKHPSGYVTRYSHLGDITVHKGQNVLKGKKIGEVGNSGNSFASHLHLELMKDGRFLDPASYFFVDVTPEKYVNMLYMSVHTQQSMD